MHEPLLPGGGGRGGGVVYSLLCMAVVVWSGHRPSLFPLQCGCGFVTVRAGDWLVLLVGWFGGGWGGAGAVSSVGCGEWRVPFFFCVFSLARRHTPSLPVVMSVCRYACLSVCMCLSASRCNCHCVGMPSGMTVSLSVCLWVCLSVCRCIGRYARR